MELTKELLRQFLDEHPAISWRKLSKEAQLNPSYIHQLFNEANRPLGDDGRIKLTKLLPGYGWRPKK